MSTIEPNTLIAAVQRYLDLMYDCDVSNFERVFFRSAQLHGFRDGVMTCWSAEHYKSVLAGRQSPKSQKAPREEQILMLDIASPVQALVKVRVRIGSLVYVDHLSYHRIEGHWLITAKSYHREV